MSLLNEYQGSNPKKFIKMMKAIEASIRPSARTEPVATRDEIKAILDKFREGGKGYIKDMNKTAAKARCILMMTKTAGWQDALGSIADKATGTAFNLGTNTALLAPAAAGLLGGAAVSKLTSPAGSATVAQKALLAAELEEALAEMKRKRTIETMKEVLRDGQGYKGRSLHI